MIFKTIGEMIQERIDSLEEAISELENLEYPDCDSEDYKLDDSDKEDKAEEEIEQEEKDLFEEALNNFESEIISIIENIC